MVSTRPIKYLDHYKDIDQMYIARWYDCFFSYPDNSSYIMLDFSQRTYILRVEIMEILPKKTFSYILTNNNENFYINISATGEKYYEFHFSLMKNTQEPIHLHQAIFASIQKFFKAGSNKNNQSNSFNIKETQSNADS